MTHKLDNLIKSIEHFEYRYMYILDISHSVRNTLIFLTTQLYKTEGKT